MSQPHTSPPFNPPPLLLLSSPSSPLPSLLITLCGLPGAGKSTFARMLKQVLPGVVHREYCYEPHITIVEYDQVLEQEKVERGGHTSTDRHIHTEIDAKRERNSKEEDGWEDSVLWKESRHTAFQTIERILSLSQTLPSSPNEKEETQASAEDTHAHAPQIVIADDNMYYRSMRYHLFKLARKCESLILFLVSLILYFFLVPPFLRSSLPPFHPSTLPPFPSLPPFLP